MSDAELVALGVCQAAIGISSDRQFLGLVERVLPGWFPHLPEQSRSSAWPTTPAARRAAASPAPPATATPSRSTATSTASGSPLSYTLVPANEKEYEPVPDLLIGTEAQLLLADKGLWGRAYRARLASAGTTLVTPAKERTPANADRERALAGRRLVIESVFANLKGQMRLGCHLAKTPAGLAARIAQRLLALTLAILLNTLTGRPARAVAAYDGR